MSFRKNTLICIFLACFIFAMGQVTAQPEVPAARSGFALVYDAGRNVVVLFGGQDIDSKKLGDTWEWGNGGWKKITIDGPPARVNATIAYNESLKSTLLFGGLADSGLQNDTWAYDGKTWKRLKTDVSPTERQMGIIVYDKARAQLVLFGGRNKNKQTLGDTWTMKNNSWTQLNIPGPPPRASHAMTYNDDTQAVIVNAGYDTDLLKDIWQFKDGVWKNLDASDGPPTCHESISYDPDQKRILMFGGFGAEGRTNELWQYANNKWTQIKPEGIVPETRAEHRSVFIPGKGLFVFGGVIGADPNTRNRGNDTWLYHSNAWQKLN